MFSFKLRGAYNKMASLSAEQLARGVICSSAGNHAQGVALAASHLVRSRAPGRARVRVGQGRHLDAGQAWTRHTPGSAATVQHDDAKVVPWRKVLGHGVHAGHDARH